MNTTVLEISSLLGLCAIIALSFNFLLGVLVSTSYKRSLYWKRLPSFIKKINLLQVHNWTAYVALVLIVFHPLILLADQTTKFLLPDVFIPFHSAYQTFWVALGIISFYAVFVVIITTQKFCKRKLGFKIWKRIHLISYATVLLSCFHGIFLDPQLKNRPPDFFDGEKLVSEACLLLFVVTFFIRYWHSRNRLQTQQ